ncbi:MAG TPA: cytochrome P450 [Myxococcota bacterium]|nr:cytochrome P450 [Myxococcota bacterium]
MPEPLLLNPLDPAFRRDPYAVYERGRRESPVLRHAGLPLRVTSVFRYDDCQTILRDPETWSNSFPVTRLLGDEADLPPPSMIATDPPQHTRLRSLVSKAFTPRIVSRLEPRMREVAAELVEAAVEAGEVDLVEALTYPLPVVVIAEIIGIPPADRARFKRWSDEAIASLGLVFFGGMDPERVARQRRLFDEMRAYFVPLAEERKREPREDLLTGLVLAEHEGSKLSYEEMLSMLVLLLVAGNETTTTLIGNATLELLAHPDAEKRLRDDPRQLPAAIDEVLRFASPVQFDPRCARRRVELGGVVIEPDDFVLCWLGSANRDERVFERPDVFDIGRERNPHLAFGFGPHYCLGANLARLEAQVAIGELLARTRGLERVGAEELPLHPSPVFRAVTKLPVRLTPR